MVSEFTKQEIINAGIRKGASYKKIGDVLESQGYSRDYNPLTTLENYKQLGPNLVQNATNMARDLRTFGGVMVQPLVGISRDVYNAKWGTKQDALKKSFQKAVADDDNRKLYGSTIAGGVVGNLIPRVGPIGGALTGAGYSMTGGWKPLANAVLSSYDTSLEDITKAIKGEKPKGELLNDIVQGAFRNPLYATLDTAPVTGRAIAKGATKLPEYMPKTLREIMPTAEQRQLNRDITQSIVSAKAKAANVYQGYLELDSLPLADREELIRDITTNTGRLDDKTKKLSNTIKKDIRAAEKDFIDRGYLDADVAKSNTIAQYIMQFLDDDRILHGHMEYYTRSGQHFRDTKGQVRITTDDPSDFMVEMILKTEPELKAKIDKLAREADKLYDDGKIAFFTQKLAPVKDPLGNVIASNIAKEGEGYFGTKRIIGKTPTDKWAKVFDDSLKFQLDELSKIMEAEDVVADIIRKYNIEDASNISKEALEAKRLEGKEVFSQEAFKEYVKNRFEAGKDVDISKALRHAQTAGEGSLLIDKMYLKALDNAFKKPADKGGRGLLNSFKKAVLANPHWIMLNRIGNLTNNYMEGVKLSDYIEAALNKDIIPNQLKQQTSFNSYINAGADNALSKSVSALKQPINRWIRAGERFGVSDKGLGDYWKLITERVSASSDITANPFFKAESALELADRSANMVRQAKRMASKTKGKTWKQILKDANNNDELFNKLNTSSSNCLC